MKKEQVAVLFGGPSVEHEISVITALQAIDALDSTRYEILPVYIAPSGKWHTGNALLDREFYRSPKYEKLKEITLLPDPTIGGFFDLAQNKSIPVDLCLLAFHGQYGEDGCVQGLLEMADLAYTGSDAAASSLTMNKYQTKSFLKTHRIPVLPSILIKKEEAIRDFDRTTEKILETLSFPLFVKPNHLGSSIGIAAADDLPSLQAALAKVFQYDDQALIEPRITNLMELNVSILDGYPPIASVVEIPLAAEGALTYEDKYLRGGNKITGASLEGMAGLTRIIDPSDLQESFKKKTQELSLQIFELLNCSGVCRIDYLWDKDANVLYFNELNSIPGSLSYYLWEHSTPSILYTELLKQLLEQARQRKAFQRSLKRDRKGLIPS